MSGKGNTYLGHILSSKLVHPTRGMKKHSRTNCEKGKVYHMPRVQKTAHVIEVATGDSFVCRGTKQENEKRNLVLTFAGAFEAPPQLIPKGRTKGG